jgi:penicillin-binding protein 1A
MQDFFRQTQAKYIVFLEKYQLQERGTAVLYQFSEWWSAQQKGALALRVAIIGALSAIFFVVALVIAVGCGSFGKIPTAQELKTIETHTASEIYSSDSLLIGKYYVENRTNANFNEISPAVINALVATEDVRFFQHNGIDVKSWMRVFFRSILLSDEHGGGGSTLSQQLAKNLYPRKKHFLLSTPINKIREMFVARRLESIYSKEDLLKLYLNTVSFSENIFGIEVAAQRFFQKKPNKLRIQEAATLIGTLKGTSLYNPVRHPDRALTRRNTVLSQMVKYGYIKKRTCDSLQKTPLALKYQRENSNEGTATYFRENLRRAVEEKLVDFQKEDGTPYNLYTDGLKITTTINAKMQQLAEEAMKEQMARLQKDFDAAWKNAKPWGNETAVMEAMKKSPRWRNCIENGMCDEDIEKLIRRPIPMTLFAWKGDRDTLLSPLDSIKYYYKILNTGFLMIDHHNGAVRAWVGGVDYKYFKYDHITSRRQVGSTFKPIVYAAALKTGVSPCEYFEDRLVTYTDYSNWKPQNSDNLYGGQFSMTGALTYSVNTIAIELLMRAGIPSVRDLAAKMGISTEIPAVPSIALGATDASLMDMVRVYGTIANQGAVPNLWSLAKIETAEGEILFDDTNKYRENAFETVLAPDIANEVRKMLESVVDNGTAQRLRTTYGLNSAIAGKTGTTQAQADGWFLGFTPTFTFGAWVGAEMPRVRFRSLSMGQGANTALPICGLFLQKFYKDPKFKHLQYYTFHAPLENAFTGIDCPLVLKESNMQSEGVAMEFNRPIEQPAAIQVATPPVKPTETEEVRASNSIKIYKDKQQKSSQKENEPKKRNKVQKFFDNLFGRNKE